MQTEYHGDSTLAIKKSKENSKKDEDVTPKGVGSSSSNSPLTGQNALSIDDLRVQGIDPSSIGVNKLSIDGGRVQGIDPNLLGDISAGLQLNQSLAIPTKSSDRRPQVNLRISTKTKEKLSELSSWSLKKNPIVSDGLISAKDFDSKYDLLSSSGFKSETALAVLILEAEVDRMHTHHQNVRDIGRIYELLRDGKNENEIAELAVGKWGIPKAVIPALISVSKKWLTKEKVNPEAERIKQEAKKRLAELAKLDDFNQDDI